MRTSDLRLENVLSDAPKELKIFSCIFFFRARCLFCKLVIFTSHRVVRLSKRYFEHFAIIMVFAKSDESETFAIFLMNNI